MFGQPGTVYLYRSYGIHVLLNFVCEAEGVGSAVLVRSFAPMGGTERLECNRRMAGTRRRGVDSASRPNFRGLDLSRGPGRVGQALGLSLGLNGLPLGARSGLFVIDDGWRREVACTTRVGITRGDCLLLRYCMIGSTYVTGQRKTTTGDGT